MSNFFSVDSFEPCASTKISNYLFSTLEPIILSNTPLIFICIGSDRSTGDSLGPLVGYKLKHIYNKSIHIYGSLDYPVHAKNLEDTLLKINSYFNNPYIIAVDSCLGKSLNIGKIIIKQQPLIPGAALNKNLSPIGNMSIIGIVNIAGTFDFLTLQSTKLSIVMNLADTISQAIFNFSLKIKNITTSYSSCNKKNV